MTIQTAGLREDAGLRETRAFVRDHGSLAREIGIPFEKWARQCHAISLKLVKSGLLGPARVARGACDGVGGQHSWIVLGDDCYSRKALIVDPTLWSYDSTVKGISVSLNSRDGRHTPHGAGNIMEWGKPQRGGGPVIRLTPEETLSEMAVFFLEEMLGPLDRQGWASLSSAPVEDWPAGEIFAAMDDTEELKTLVPIDILGMTTRRNPGGLYF